MPVLAPLAACWLPVKVQVQVPVWALVLVLALVIGLMLALLPKHNLQIQGVEKAANRTALASPPDDWRRRQCARRGALLSQAAPHVPLGLPARTARSGCCRL